MGEPLKLDIKFDASEFEAQLQKHLKGSPKIAKKMVRAVLNPQRRDTRRLIRATFPPNSSAKFAKAVDVNAFGDFGGSVLIRKRGAVQLTKGHTQQVMREHGWLTFKVNGEWRKVKSTTTLARPVMKDAAEKYWGNGGAEASRLMNAVLQAELDKIYGAKK